MQAAQSGRRLWLIFSDATAARETYRIRFPLCRRAVSRRPRDARLQPRLQPAVRLQPVHDLPGAAAAEPAVSRIPRRRAQLRTVTRCARYRAQGSVPRWLAPGSVVTLPDQERSALHCRCPTGSEATYPGAAQRGGRTRRQNLRSSRSVIRWPFSRSRLISISFRPASRPAACCAFGRPRTSTVGLRGRAAVDDRAGPPGDALDLRGEVC